MQIPQNAFFCCHVGTIKRKRFHFRRIYHNRLLLVFKIGVYSGNNETFGFIIAFYISWQHVFLITTAENHSKNSFPFALDPFKIRHKSATKCIFKSYFFYHLIWLSHLFIYKNSRKTIFQPFFGNTFSFRYFSTHYAERLSFLNLSPHSTVNRLYLPNRHQ